MRHHSIFKKALLFLTLIAWPIFFPALVLGEEVKICLTMMVKNDQEVIYQCLNSVKELIDCITVCDTGSTDNTIDIIKQFMAETGIPGKIHPHEWQDFGKNKTLLAQAAQKDIKDLGFALPSTYLLNLDADSVLKIGTAFRKDSLTKDAYLLLEKSSVLSFCSYDIRFIRASMKWESVGVVHEYWSCKDSYTSEKLRTLMTEDLGDETSRDEKLKRYVKILTKALRDDPNNARYMFYLAQSYRCLKRYEEAILWYRARIEKHESRDEVCFSKYMIGECYEEMEEWDPALRWYLDAYQCNPKRAESLRKIATYYRRLGQNDLAYLFAKHGSRLPIPNDQFLLNSPPLYEYQFDEELSIAAYYTPFRDEGYAASSDLVLRRNVPWYIKTQGYKNLLFYTENLKNVRFQAIKIDLPLVQKGYEERYHPMNPSIFKTEDGYELICRAVNYTQTGAKIFNTIDEHGIYRTKNFLVHYDRGFNMHSQHEIYENLERERRYCIVEGLEDCRIVKFDNSLWFTCTTADTNPTGQRQISLCKLDNEKVGKIVEVEKLVPLLGRDLNRCEKNWLPFVKDGSLHIVYSSDPFVIFKPDIETGECKTVLEYKPPLDFTSFRGSGGPIEFDDGYLMLVHEVALLPEYERCYLHRFLYLDKNFIAEQISKPFTFQHQGVEFCASMTIDHSGKELIMPIGIEDREAYLCFIDLATVRSLLHPLPKSAEPPFEN